MSTHLHEPLINASSVGGRIRQARRLRDITQEGLAATIGASRESVSMWERDKTSPPFAELVLIARAVRIPIGVLVDGLDEDPSECAPWDLNPEPADSRFDPNQLALIFAVAA